ncbi:DNA alkylation repair protein [Candidatus Marithrix sp. Canyon 246]|uniref:DNA alkylation repair protein n=2 Tax=Candidatus Marithrix sp. Canyon 246 TaxID=1827136 RepID=UPI0009F3A031|nr:DNA alkylation repair protein [Candidatus Marithrix sp. Canyon 246]
MIYQTILDHLHSLSNPEIAKHSQHFFKTAKGEYGYGDKFLGIRVPMIRQTVKKYKNTSLEVTQKLLQSNYHEIRLFALLVLVEQFSKANADQQNQIYKIYLANTQYINNWDLVDTTAPHIVGKYLDNKDKSILHELSKSSCLWKRRIAIMSTFTFIRNHDFEETLQISELLLNDQEDLIHKAVGWMLREIGKRNLLKETEFLKLYYKTMPRTMLRYAIEKFNKEERQKYLKGLI